MKGQFVYVVLGYEKQDNESFNKEVYGVYSTEELAKECAACILKELKFLSGCEIERVQLDEFGYR